MTKQRKNSESHSEEAHKVDIEEVAVRTSGSTGTDRTWSAVPVARKGFAASHRIFEKHFKGRLKKAAEQTN